MPLQFRLPMAESRTVSRLSALIALILLSVLGWAAPAGANAPSSRDAGGAPLRPAGTTGPLGDERLSDETTLTRIGWPQRPHPIRTAPRRDARRIGRLRFFTEDRAPENYLVLRSALDARGKPWLHIRLPRRPNGATGWVPAHVLRMRIRTTLLEVDKRRLKARLFRDGREIWTAGIGIGARATPTPSGRYWIREKLRNLGGSPIYGPLAFGTAAYSRLSDWPGGGVVGVHGTDAPGLIPGRPSHGCIRVRNAKILSLARLMPVGTPVWIH